MIRLTVVVACLVLAVIVAFGYTEYRRARETSALHEAVYRSDLAAVTRLLSVSRDIDQRNRGEALGMRIRRYPLPYENDVTALYVAAAQTNPELVELLLRNGANPNLEFRGYDTILHRAIINLAPSLNIHGYDLSAEPPFDRDAAIEVIRLLVTHGADIEHRSRPDSETPLEMCNRLDEHEVYAKMLTWWSARVDAASVMPNSP